MIVVSVSSFALCSSTSIDIFDLTLIFIFTDDQSSSSLVKQDSRVDASVVASAGDVSDHAEITSSTGISDVEDDSVLAEVLSLREKLLVEMFNHFPRLISFCASHESLNLLNITSFAVL